jgi:OMF family outer membrane factor
MKLVNIHKQYLILFVTIIGLNSAQAQVYTLQQCIDTAQVHNKNLKMSRNTISMGKEKEQEAKANLIPKITANADYKYYTNLPYQLMPLSIFGGPEGQFKEAQFGVHHNINANLQLTMPLYNPQVYGAIQTTKIAAELTDIQYLKTEEQIYFEISNLYYNAQILQHQISFIDSNLVNVERLLSTIQLLNEQLLAKGTDVNKVKLQKAQLTAQKVTITSKYDQVLNGLKYAMGLSIEQNISIESKIQYEILIEYVSSSTLDMRLTTTQNRLLSSELSTLNKSRFLPSLNLVGTFGTTGFGYDKQPNEFLKFYPIGLAGMQLSYPLFSGTVTLRKINQKRLELQNNELQLALLTDQNNLQVQNAKLQRKVTLKSIETTTEQIELAQSIYEQTVIQQKQGTANLTDVLLADNTLREAQQNYLSNIVEYLKVDLELKKITGNLLIKN